MSLSWSETADLHAIAEQMGELEQLGKLDTLSDIDRSVEGVRDAINELRDQDARLHDEQLEALSAAVHSLDQVLSGLIAVLPEAFERLEHRLDVLASLVLAQTEQQERIASTNDNDRALQMAYLARIALALED